MTHAGDPQAGADDAAARRAADAWSALRPDHTRAAVRTVAEIEAAFLRDHRPTSLIRRFTTADEVAALGVPTVLVPWPLAAEDHQTANAEGMVTGAAADLVDVDGQSAVHFLDDRAVDQQVAGQQPRRADGLVAPAATREPCTKAATRRLQQRAANRRSLA